MCEEGSVVYGNTGDGAHAIHESACLHARAMPDDMSFSTGAAVSCGTGTAFERFNDSIFLAGTLSQFLGKAPWV